MCDRAPLVPVTLTVKVPVTDPMQDRVEVPEPPVILVEDRVQTSPVDGDTVSASPTVPVKPLTGDTVMVEVPAVPTTAVTLVGLALIVKSGAAVTVNVTVAV